MRTTGWPFGKLDPYLRLVAFQKNKGFSETKNVRTNYLRLFLLLQIGNMSNYNSIPKEKLDFKKTRQAYLQILLQIIPIYFLNT